MALLAIQLVRVVFTCQLELQAGPTPLSLTIALDVVIRIHQMLNVIIKICFIFYFFVFADNIFTCLGHCTNNNFGAGLDEIVFR